MATHVPEMSRFGLELSQEKLHDDLGYVNLLREIDTPTGIRPAYLSVSMLRQWAARIPQIGLVSADDARRLQLELDALRAELDQVKAERDELRARQERINGIAKDGFKIVRQQGRPSKGKVAG